MMDDMLGPTPMHIKCHMYTTDVAYDGPIFLVPLSPSYPSSPVVTFWTALVQMSLGPTPDPGADTLEEETPSKPGLPPILLRG